MQVSPKSGVWGLDTCKLEDLSVSPKYEIDVHDREMLDLHRNSCKYVNVGYTAYASSNFPNDDLGIVKTVVLA
jgi:hypothetical protein